MNTRRDFLKMAGLGAASLALSQNLGSAARSNEKPNIVFLLADDLGFKDVGYQGGAIKTPNINKLAAAGTRIDQFYVQPVCSPTRSSLMTGRYPMRYGLQVGVVRPWAQHGLPLEERTLAEALKEAGYTTAICGKWHLGHLDHRYLPTARGFDHQYGHYNGALDYFTHIRDKALDWNRDDKPLREEGYTTDLLADESVRLIEQHDFSRPLFLYVPFNAVHSPFQAPQSYLDMYRHIKQRNKRVFAAMVTCMDDAVGRIVSAIDKRGVRRNTLIFFCSDNGGVGSVSDNGPLRGQKAQLYEGGIRVPAVAVWPGVLEAGAVVRGPLHIVDMYPTLLKLARSSMGVPPMNRLGQRHSCEGRNACDTHGQDAHATGAGSSMGVPPMNRNGQRHSCEGRNARDTHGQDAHATRAGGSSMGVPPMNRHGRDACDTHGQARPERSRGNAHATRAGGGPLDGRDAWATISQGRPSPHEEILLNVTPYNGAIRCGDWKLIQNGHLGANYTDPTPAEDTFELFNLADDPHEKNDLSGKNPQKLEELKRRLKHYADTAAKANIPPNRMPDDFKIPSAWGHPD